MAVTISSVVVSRADQGADGGGRDDGECCNLFGGNVAGVALAR
jgi:hypothetical protein